MKRTVILKESELRRMISESVKRVLNENTDEYSKSIILDVLSNTKSLRELESVYPFAKNILCNDESNGKMMKNNKHCIIVQFGGTAYQVFDVEVHNNKDVYVYLVSLQEQSDGGYERWYELKPEFNEDYDEKEITIEEFQRLFPSQYNELINRFNYVANRIFV